LKLLHGDCLDLMSDIPDKSVDMVMADPPYGTTACKWDSIIPLEPMWEHLKRVIKKNGAIVMTASQPFTTTLISSNMGMFQCEWIWEKTTPSNIAVKTAPMKYHEEVIVFCKSNPIFNKQLEPRSKTGQKSLKNRKATIKFSSAKTQEGVVDKREYSSGRYNIYFKHPSSIQKFVVKKGNVHPTQKPVALMEYLIKTYTNEGETVLDFCMGSGTTGVACLNLNRKFIGIEKDPDYFKIATERIDRAQEQPGLFN